MGQILYGIVSVIAQTDVNPPNPAGPDMFRQLETGKYKCRLNYKIAWHYGIHGEPEIQILQQFIFNAKRECSFWDQENSTINVTT